MSKKNHYNFENPFSEEFLKIWEIWKEYKWASHKFKYKSVFSEQAAIEQLWTLSKANEEVAVKIIKQSMRREWQGLFPLHETTTGNGKPKKSNPDTGNGSVTDSFKAQFVRSNGKRADDTDSSHLKAV